MKYKLAWLLLFFILGILIVSDGYRTPSYIESLTAKSQGYWEAFEFVDYDVSTLNENPSLLSNSMWMGSFKNHIVELNRNIYGLASSTTDTAGISYVIVNDKVLELAIETRMFTNAYDKQILSLEPIWLPEMVDRTETINRILLELAVLLEEYR